MQQSIRDQLRNTREQLLKSAYLEMLRDQAKVENYYAEEIFKAGSAHSNFTANPSLPAVKF